MNEKIILSLFGLVLSAEAQLTLARNGKSFFQIIIQPGATITEKYAGEELAFYLEKITDAKFEIEEILPGEVPERGIIIGYGELTERIFPEVVDYLKEQSSPFGGEQIIIRTKKNYLLIAGGRPRGTLYAVYRFLSIQLGVRWWTPWATTIPKKRTLILPNLSIEEKPAFEYREPFWYSAFDDNWAARNYYNGNSAHLTEKHGGKITYKGFVHTFYALVPPKKYFEEHPEWFSLINGKRQWERAQLCCTNPNLRDFITEKVRQWLKESPEANIVSISQNDWGGNCQCENCRNLDEREGTPIASILDMVNDIAERLEKEFPNVSFDTLAYQYTRKPLKTIKPRVNVIIRLCSIECNFAQPLEDESNKSFAEDIHNWFKITKRIYIWDYTTNFLNYVQPHPNWFSLGPNLRFFHIYGVSGVFEQGAYQSHGAEFAELRAWVLAQLLWNPYQDDKKLIYEFLEGYYGKAAPYIWQYMELMHKAVKNYYLSCYVPAKTPFFNFETLSKAENLWQKAEKAVKDNPEIYWRVRQAHMPVYYAFLNNWARLRIECARRGSKWPFSFSRKEIAQEWLSVVTGKGPTGWTPMTHVNEGGLTPQRFVESLGEDDPELEKLPKKIPKKVSFPSDIPGIDPKKCVDVQDDKISIWEEIWKGNKLACYRVDMNASDYLAVWMPGWHHEWACKVYWKSLPKKLQKGCCKIYAVIKVDKKAGIESEKDAIWAGVYHEGKKTVLAEVIIPVRDIGEGYCSYLIGTVESSPEQYIWIAPPASGINGPVRLSPGQGNIEGLWIDRIIFVPTE